MQDFEKLRPGLAQSCEGSEFVLEQGSGLPGIDQGTVDQFFDESTAYVAWLDLGEKDSAIRITGTATENAAAALAAVRAKVDDYFARCRLAAFDPKMPGYDQLRANVDALVQQGDVVSSAELVGSEGDDRRRSLELDWVLSVAHPDTAIILFRRHERVKCQVERQGKGWRIVALEPIEFLAPEKPR